MRDLAMNFDTNDLDLKNGDLYMASESDTIAQMLQQALQLWLGEWFLDTRRGVPYRQRILVKGPNIDEVRSNIINTAISVPGVTEVTDVSFNYNNAGRSVTMAVVAKTSNGETITVQADVGLPGSGTIQGVPQ